MRLWHKDMIHVLPEKQLLGQWREVCLIARAINRGNLNHVLVNKVKDYDPEHLYAYGALVYHEMVKRDYKAVFDRFAQYFPAHIDSDVCPVTRSKLYDGWHNDRYLRQCYANLEEKYDCGGVPDDEWRVVADFYNKWLHKRFEARRKELER